MLGPLINRVLEDKSLKINTNPIEIYKQWVNQVRTMWHYVEPKLTVLATRMCSKENVFMFCSYAFRWRWRAARTVGCPTTSQQSRLWSTRRSKRGLADR